MAKRKKSSVKASAKKTVRKAKGGQGFSLSGLKSVLMKMEKTPSQAIAGAKKLLKNPSKQTKAMVANYKKQAKNLSTQWAIAQKKLTEAEAKMEKQATATTKSAVKKAKKAYADIQKKVQKFDKEYHVASTVSEQVKNLGDKFDYLAKEVMKAAKTWKAPEGKKHVSSLVKKPAAKKAAAKAKPAAKKVAAKPDAAFTPPKVPLYKAPAAPANKPASQPMRNPFSPPITPGNIAQKPLAQKPSTGSNPQQSRPDAGHKPFNFDKDDF